MAISLEALNAFRPASAWDDNATLNLNEEGGVGAGGTYGRLSKFRNREEPEKAANNAVRTALLKALARTFDISTGAANGETRFSQDFMEKLEKMLGPAFRRDDFNVGEDGVVASGRPLTARRIKAILASAQDAADDEAHNRALMPGFTGDAQRLGQGFVGMMSDVRAKVLRRFGDDGTPDEDELHLLVPARLVSDRILESGAKRATPDGMRDWYLKLAINEGARRFATRQTAKRLTALGKDPGCAKRLFNSIAVRHPEIVSRIAQAKSPAAAKAEFDRFVALIDASIRRDEDCTACMQAFPDRARTALAGLLDVPPELLDGFGTMDNHVLSRIGENLRVKILDGDNPADGRAEIDADFLNKAFAFADERRKAFAAIDAMDLPAAAKDRLKMEVLSYDKIDYLRFDRIFTIGNGPQPDNLIALIDANAPKNDIYNELRTITNAINTEIDAMVNEARAAGKEIGPDEITSLRRLALEVFLGKVPGLRERLVSFLRRPDVAGDDFHDNTQPSYVAFQFEHIMENADAKGHVLANLGTPQLHPVYAQALVVAANEAGRRLSPADALALFAAGQPKGDLLREALGQFEGELDTTTLKAFAIGVLQRQ